MSPVADDRDITSVDELGDSLETWLSLWLSRLEDEGADSRLEAGRVLEEAPEPLRPLLREQMSSMLELASSTLGGAAVSEGQTVEGYRLGEVLGRGATGVVWSATSPAGEVCAIKFVHSLYLASPEGVERLGREVGAASRVNHPGLVGLRGTLEFGGNFGLISNRVGDGSTLADELQRAERQGLTVDGPRTLQRLLPVLRGVAELHRADVLHLDLKPGNILVGEDGSLKVTDFGLARLVDQPGTTRTFQLLGTPAYMAPELARGDRRSADQRADVFSLGVTLYEALCLRRPFLGSGSRGVLEAVLHDEPALLPGPLAGLSGRQLRCLRSVLARCLEKSPARRYQQADELVEDVEAVLAGREVRGSSVWRQALATCRRRKRPIAAAALIALLVVVGWRDRGLRRNTDEALAITGQLVDAMQPGGRPPEHAELEPLVRDLQRLLRDTSRPLREQTLAGVGALLSRRGETTDLALELLEEALSLAREEGARAELLFEIGLLRHRRFELAASVDYFQQAGRIFGAQGGELASLRRAFCVARASSNQLQLGRGHAEGAGRSVEEAIALVQEALASTPPQLERALRARLELESLQLRYELSGGGIPLEELERMEALLAELRRELVPEHPWVIEALTLVGNAMTDHRRLRAARALLEEASRLADRSLGENHVQALLARARLGRVCLEDHQLHGGDMAEGLRIYSAVVPALEEQLGRQNRTVIDLSVGLFVAMELSRWHESSRGSWSEADRLLEEQVKLVEDLLGRVERGLSPHDPVHVSVWRAWGGLCVNTARHQEGREAFARLWAEYSRDLRRHRLSVLEDLSGALGLELYHPAGVAEVEVVLERVRVLQESLEVWPLAERRDWTGTDFLEKLGIIREVLEALRIGLSGDLEDLEGALAASTHLPAAEKDRLRLFLRVLALRREGREAAASRLLEGIWVDLRDLWSLQARDMLELEVALVRQGLRSHAAQGNWELLETRLDLLLTSEGGPRYLAPYLGDLRLEARRLLESRDE